MPYTFDPDEIGIVAEGLQVLTVDEIKETESKKGDPMWIVRLTDSNGYELTDFIVHKPNIIDWKFRPLWEAAGLTWPEGRAVLDERRLVGRQVQVTVKHERSEDFGLQARAHGYSAVGISDTDPDGQASIGFSAQASQPVPAAAEDDDDDEIPFD